MTDDPSTNQETVAETTQNTKKQTRVVAIGNQKGGVGKTTTTINLAACLGELGVNVLVLDLDPQSNASSGLGLPKQEGTSIYNSLIENKSAFDLIQNSVAENVDIIPAELDLAGAEIDVARMDNYLHCVRNAIDPITETGIYDFIFVDCPPSLGILTMNALTLAHSFIAPIQCEYYALEGLSVISGMIDKLHDSGVNPELEIEGILMTMYDSRNNLSSQVVAEVRAHFEEKLYDTIIPRNVRLSEAPSYGIPIIQYDASSKGAAAYRQLALEFVKRRGWKVEESSE